MAIAEKHGTDTLYAPREGGAIHLEHEATRVLLDLLVVFAAGKFAGELFERMRQPAVIGELLAGVIIGPGLLGWVAPSTALQTVAMMGVIVLMFAVGLETKPSELFKVGGTSFQVGTIGVILPFAFGVAFGMTMGFERPEALFIGTALVATSVGITARVLADRGLISAKESRIVLAAAVIDDVLGMLVLSIVTGTATEGSIDMTHLAVVLAQVVIFIGFELWIAPRVVSRHAHLLDKLHIPNPGLVVALVVMLGMAALSEALGLAGIVGAFFAGMMFAETEDRFDLVTQSRPLYEWLVPYFFVATGMQVQVKTFADPAVLLPGLVLVFLAIVGKVVGCGLAASGLGWKRALAVGVGMVPRGEVGLIVASAGLASGIIAQSVYAMVVLVVVVTTVIVPPLLAVVFPWAMRDESVGSPAVALAED